MLFRSDASTSTSEQQGDDAELAGQRDERGLEHPSPEGKSRWVHVRRASQEKHAPSVVSTDPGRETSIPVSRDQGSCIFPCAISHLTRRPMAIIAAPFIAD